MVPRREFIDEGDVFDISDTIGNHASRGNIQLGGLSEAHQNLHNRHANQEFLWMLEQQFAFLVADTRSDVAMHLFSSGGSHWTLVRKDPPWRRNGEYTVRQDTSESDMAVEFAMLMDRLRINKWGILRAIVMILGEYARHGQRQGFTRPPIIRIEIEV